MKANNIFNLLILLFFLNTSLSIIAGDSFAVRSPDYYEKRIENSTIKAIAVVQSIEVLELTRRHTYKRATFKLEKSLAEPVPAIFTGTFYSVDYFWQNPGEGGIKYIYPEKGQRVLVTITENGGSITSIRLWDNLH
ncbi:MAG: hypothetical protein HQM13_13280 [SAR324 cluster bacterium]|nr:hypothetical protein [SAR324 cluster bacterium]